MFGFCIVCGRGAGSGPSRRVSDSERVGPISPKRRDRLGFDDGVAAAGGGAECGPGGGGSWTRCWRDLQRSARRGCRRAVRAKRRRRAAATRRPESEVKGRGVGGATRRRWGYRGRGEGMDRHAWPPRDWHPEALVLLNDPWRHRDCRRRAFPARIDGRRVRSYYDPMPRVTVQVFFGSSESGGPADRCQCARGLGWPALTVTGVPRWCHLRENASSEAYCLPAAAAAACGGGRCRTLRLGPGPLRVGNLMPFKLLRACRWQRQ